MRTRPPAAPATTPTRAWLDQADLTRLEGPAATAEALMLLLHYSIDWDGWVGRYRATYWDGLLVDRVLVAAYRCASLSHWWADVAAELNASPRTPAQRRELAVLLQEPAPPVLQVLRQETESLVLRTRIVADSVRAERSSSSEKESVR